MNTTMTVIVAGASGVFGRHIRATLNNAGHEVLGLGRGPGNELRADLLDREAVLAALRGVRADVVVHAATALNSPRLGHKQMYATDDLRTAGTRSLLEAARAAGVRRFIGENIVFGYGYRDFGGHILTEDEPFGGTDSNKGFAHHIEAMRDKERLPIESGFEAVSLRYGLFYGEGATESILDLIRKRRLPSLNDHGRMLPWVNLVDAANAVLAAIEHGRAGAAYNIADSSELGFGGMVDATAAAFGAPAPMHVPDWLTVAMPFVHRITKVSIRVSTEKARSELQWKPVYPTVADGLRALTRRPVPHS
jgi:nucleoside-diphosphate-sugar epimerase